MARTIMLQGTGSDAGKTLLVAGLCRIAHNRGFRARPFKPQNMSNNAAVAVDPDTGESGEIGRAQWLQAVACGVAPTVDMNPVLLKPQSETGAQIVVRGRVAAMAEARAYHQMRGELLDTVLNSWRKLCREADIVFVEGAGSASEINLRANDIANMGFATAAKVPVLLIGDIERGGVIGSLAGTHLVLPPDDRAQVCGYIVNRFRGDPRLFDEGLSAISRFTGWPCFGLVPYMAEARYLPPEDSVSLERRSTPRGASFRVAVPVLSRIANFDDLDPLANEPGVDVLFVHPGERLPLDAGLVVLPGSKSTISDLIAFRTNGWDCDLRSILARGGHVVGICGGYQMLGRLVRDPGGIEGERREVEGLGLLDVETTMTSEKTIRNVSARCTLFDMPLDGYEIHLGQTDGADCRRAPFEIDGRADGATSLDGKVIGTYLHGLFATDSFRWRFLESVGAVPGRHHYRQGVEAALDRIAEKLEHALDFDAILAAAR